MITQTDDGELIHKCQPAYADNPENTQGSRCNKSQLQSADKESNVIFNFIYFSKIVVQFILKDLSCLHDRSIYWSYCGRKQQSIQENTCHSNLVTSEHLMYQQWG